MKYLSILLLVLAISTAHAQIGNFRSDEVFARAYGARNQATIQSVINMINTSYRTIVLDGGSWEITSALTVPANITLDIRSDSYLDMQSSAALTLSGGLIAPVTPVFRGTRQAHVTGLWVAHPYWWASDGVVNAAAAVVPASGTATAFTGLTLDEETITDWYDVGEYIGPIPAVTNLSDYFSTVSNDFRVLHAYLLGGTVSNEFTNVTWTAQGDADWPTNSALVRSLEYNQGITTTNFMNVNVNTEATTNLFLIIADQLLGLEGESLTNFMDWVAAYRQMDTDYLALPTNLVFSFSSIYEGETLGPIVDAFEWQSLGTGGMGAQYGEGATNWLIEGWSDLGAHLQVNFYTVTNFSQTYGPTEWQPYLNQTNGVITLPADGNYAVEVAAWAFAAGMYDAGTNVYMYAAPFFQTAANAGNTNSGSFFTIGWTEVFPSSAGGGLLQYTWVRSFEAGTTMRLGLQVFPEDTFASTNVYFQNMALRATYLGPASSFLGTTNTVELP
jgi:hypothetical protein